MFEEKAAEEAFGESRCYLSPRTNISDRLHHRFKPTLICVQTTHDLSPAPCGPEEGG